MRSMDRGGQDSVPIVDGSVCALHCPSVGVRVPLDALDLDTSSSEVPVHLLIVTSVPATRGRELHSLPSQNSQTLVCGPLQL